MSTHAYILLVQQHDVKVRANTARGTARNHTGAARFGPHLSDPHSSPPAFTHFTPPFLKPPSRLPSESSALAQESANLLYKETYVNTRDGWIPTKLCLGKQATTGMI